MAWFKRLRRLRRLAAQAEENRHRAELEAERNRQLKREMTSNIAHELKTPVSSIRGYLEILLSDKPLTDERRRYFLERCYSQTLRLSDLIQDVSLINKAEESADLFPKTMLDVCDVANEAILELSDKAAESSVHITNLLPHPMPFCGNHELLYSVFRNLIENAVAYAGVGSHVVVECYNPSAHPSNPLAVNPDDPPTRQSQYHIHFYDTGVGVDDQYLARLFDRFLRIDDGRSRQNGGTGLGLSIVKHAVLFHGGEIYVRNRAEGGLEFFFSLR